MNNLPFKLHAYTVFSLLSCIDNYNNPSTQTFNDLIRYLCIKA